MGRPSKTKVLIAETKKALTKGDGNELLQCLTQLIDLVGDRAVQLLILDDAIPSAANADFSTATVVIMAAIQLALSSAGHPLVQQSLTRVVDAMVASEQIVRHFEYILTRRRKLEFFKRTNATKILAMMTFAESQVRYGLRYNVATAEKTVDVSLLLNSSVESKSGGAKGSVGGAIEGTIDAVELAVRECLHDALKFGFGELDVLPPVYQDEDFETAVTLAVYWQKLIDLESRGRFLEWRPVRQLDQSNTYSPPNLERFRMESAAEFRHGLYLLEISQSFMPHVMPRATNTPERIDALARSMTLPSSPGAPWNGVIDMAALRATAANSTWTMNSRIFLSELDCEALLAQAHIQANGMSIGWSQWLAASCLVRVLGEAFIAASAADSHVDSWRNWVISISHANLAGLFSIIPTLAPLASALVAALTFDPKRKRMEIYDTPFVPVGPDMVIFAPSIAAIGSPIRALENIVLQYGESNAFSIRGKPFEKKIASIWDDVVGARYVQGRRSKAPGGTQVEFDLLVHWQGYLLFLEVKCVKSIVDPADRFRANADIRYSFDQLRYRREVVMKNWLWLRQLFPDLDLPEHQFSSDRLLLLAVTNSLLYTGVGLDVEIPVIDRVALERYFTDPEIKKMAVSRNSVEDLGVVGTVRTGPPSPLGLIEYAKRPWQFASVDEATTLGEDWLLRLNEHDDGIRFVVAQLDRKHVEEQLPPA